MTVTILHGDCREVLRMQPDESAHCAVTSPPYWGLRDYGVPHSIWGGDDGCEHEWGSEIAVNATNHTGKARWNHTRNGRDEEQPVEKRVSWLRTEVKQGQFCQRCNAWAGAHGLEPTPQLFVENEVRVFREVRRVLRDDATLWLNLGDSYQNAKGQAHGVDPKQPARRHGLRPQDVSIEGLKPKDLVGIPWMVAFALRADGWYLRQDIIWSKPNPMPESVTDRCTKAHEYLFLLSKSARYYYDADAITEAASRPEGAGNITHKGATAYAAGDEKMRTKLGLTEIGARDTRNKRSVWTVPTSPFAEAHFATFPPALIEPCILAGCPAGGTVLDPFGGAGTTGLVADRLGRNAILIELNPEYAAMAERRIKDDAGMFAEVSSA